MTDTLDPLMLGLLKYRRLLLYEQRLEERLAWIEERLTVLRRDMEPGSLHRQRTKCGARCRCNHGRGHGPYWYLYNSTEAGLVKRYVRRADLKRVRRRLRNYQEYVALRREVDVITDFLDTGAALAHCRIASEQQVLLEDMVWR